MSVASSAFSPDRRRDETCFRYFLAGAHGLRDLCAKVSKKVFILESMTHRSLMDTLADL